MILSRIGVASAARITGLTTAALGLVFAVIYLPIMTLFSAFAGEHTSSFFFGFGMLFFLPITYGIMGFLLGAFYAWLYNLIADRFGGLEIEMEEAR